MSIENIVEEKNTEDIGREYLDLEIEHFLTDLEEMGYMREICCLEEITRDRIIRYSQGEYDEVIDTIHRRFSSVAVCFPRLDNVLWKARRNYELQFERQQFNKQEQTQYQNGTR